MGLVFGVFGYLGTRSTLQLIQILFILGKTKFSDMLLSVDLTLKLDGYFATHIQSRGGGGGEGGR